MADIFTKALDRELFQTFYLKLSEGFTNEDEYIDIREDKEAEEDKG